MVEPGGRVTVSCCELAPVVGDLAGNLDRATAAVSDAVAGGADIIVLPELATSGYCFDSPGEAQSLALSAADGVFDRWAEIAGERVVVAGFAERAADGALFNSAMLVCGDLRVTYRKVHLWNSEQLFFRPGDRPPPVTDTPAGRIAVMVCYDMEFPEMTRSVALRGADLLAVPTNWPWVDRPSGQPAPEILIAMAAARVNRMPIACCDRRGVERGQRWNEATAILDESGWPVATATATGTATAVLDLGSARDKRISPRNDALGDRRPDVYG
jgi:predicted amidohydrolase